MLDEGGVGPSAGVGVPDQPAPEREMMKERLRKRPRKGAGGGAVESRQEEGW
jgi:hypothetical protein